MSHDIVKLPVSAYPITTEANLARVIMRARRGVVADFVCAPTLRQGSYPAIKTFRVPISICPPSRAARTGGTAATRARLPISPSRRGAGPRMSGKGLIEASNGGRGIGERLSQHLRIRCARSGQSLQRIVEAIHRVISH